MTALRWALAGRAGVPVDIPRDEARARAREELSKSMYHEQDPSVWERILRWIDERLRELFGHVVGGKAAIGYVGLLVLAALVVGIVIAVRLKLGPLKGRRRDDGALFTGAQRSAAEHRAAAERHAAAGNWAEAIRARLRAVIRELEQRGLLDPRPGRTADEAATEAGLALPTHAGSLRDGARTFDDVWYGGHPATDEAYRRIRALDEQLRSARPGTLRRPG